MPEEAGNIIKVSDIYREQYAHFRAMNDILYKIPPLFSASIGGLWFFAANEMEKDRIISAAVFVFAASLSLCGINVLKRFGNAFSAYIDNLNSMDGEYKVTTRTEGSLSTIKTVQLLFWFATFLSSVGAGRAIFQLCTL